MASNYATNLGQAFAAAPIKIFYEASVADDICNRDYEGEIKDKTSVVNVLTFGALDWSTYSGADLTATALTEVKGTLTTDQDEAYYFKVKDLDQLKSWIKEPQGTVIEQLGKRLKELVDNFVLAKYTKVAAGQRIGTDYTTGTVAVTAVTGAVVGTGTTFTAAMVGRGFKAAGQTKWYLVTVYTDATHITIQNDTDDDTAGYDGGTIAAGATYTIEAVTPVALTSTTVDLNIIKLRTKLKKAKVFDISQPWLVISSDVYAMMLQANIFTPYTPLAFEDVVKKGIVAMARGFKIYESQQVSGDNTNGYHCLAGITAWQTMAEALVEAEEEPFLPGNFGKGFKGLFVYGTKVLDERRKCAAELFATA
jgi:hypothetical protein